MFAQDEFSAEVYQSLSLSHQRSNQRIGEQQRQIIEVQISNLSLLIVASYAVNLEINYSKSTQQLRDQETFCQRNVLFIRDNCLTITIPGK